MAKLAERNNEKRLVRAPVLGPPEIPARAIPLTGASFSVREGLSYRVARAKNHDL